MSPIEIFVGLLGAVAALTWLAQKIRVEYPIFLVIGGLILGFIPGLPNAELRPDVVFLLFLPPLLYYEAFNSSLRDFRANLSAITASAVVLVVLTIAVVACAVHALIPGIPWAAAVVLGAIVGPTDETAAIAIASRLRVPRRVITIIKAESLFNDATSLVIYNVALAAVVTGTFSFAAGTWHLFIDAAGGVAIGVAVGWVLTLIRQRVDDPLLQNTISLLSGYAAYFPADALHLSGVLSALSAGLYLGRRGHTFTSPESRVQIAGMREITLFLINGTLFILVGLQLHAIMTGLSGTASMKWFLWLAVAVSLTVILVRIVWSFALTYVPRALSFGHRARGPIPSWREAGVFGWSGLRGGISLAAALAVPLVVASGAPFPDRPLILFLTFSVIFATLVGQGLTLPFVIRLLGLRSDGSAEREETLARIKATRAAYAHLEKLAKEKWADPRIVDDIRKHLRQRYDHHKARRDHTLTAAQEREAAATRRIRQELNHAESREILRLRDEGVINEATMGKLQRELDLALVGNR